MKRARILEVGWDADLAVDEIETPRAPGPGQVLIEVEACGVCHRDLIDRSGRFAFIQCPITPGHEAVGPVVASSSDEWVVGDRVATMHRDFCGTCDACRADDISLCESAASVLGLLIDGGYATHLTAPARSVYRMPDDIPASEAAILHCTFGTAYRGLKRAASDLEGKRVLITGANGGVGAAAIQIAKRLGADVIAAVRRPEHEAFVRGLGADAVIVDDAGGLHKKIGALAHVVLDCVGEPTFNSALRSLQVGGTIVVVGNIVPARAALNLGFIITKGLRIMGSSGASRVDMAELIALRADAGFEVAIEREVSLAEADEAQRLVSAGGRRGRIVIRM